MSKNVLKTKIALSLSLAGLVLSGCSFSSSSSQESQTERNQTITIKAQAKDLASNGLELTIEHLEIDIPNTKGGKATLSCDEGQIYLALEGLSIHKFSLDGYLPLAYNGVQRDLRLVVPGDETLYVSLTDPTGITTKRPGVKLKASIAPMDSTEAHDDIAHGSDSLTRGIYYYEYGQFDYFIASVLDSFGVEPYKLFNKEGGMNIDGQAIIDGFDQIKEERSSYFSYAPLGKDHNLVLGLGSDSGVLSSVDFPYQEEGGNSFYELSNGIKIRLKAGIQKASNHSFVPTYASDSYMQLEDSLGLITTLGNYVSSKQYGFNGSFTLEHKEAKVEATSTTFGHEAVNETATLTLSGNADLTEQGDAIGASLSINQGSARESLSLHLARKDDSSNRKAYLKANNGQSEENSIRLKTDIKTVSSLFANAKRALSNPDIQNEVIMALLDGLLSSSRQIQSALDAIKGSALYQSISKNEYQAVLDTIDSYSYGPDTITLTIDLSKVAMVGKATITLSKNTLSLLEVRLDKVGIQTDSQTSPFEFTLDGSLTIGGFTKPIINDAEYQEMDGLTSWEERLLDIAGIVDEEGNYTTYPTHKLAAKLSGYIIKNPDSSSGKTNKSDIAVTLTDINGNRFSSKQQGFTISGNLAFDLGKKIGAGYATFTDHKEKFLNDHNVKLDITGPESELDDATKKQNDFSGNDAPNGGYLLFQYDSRNSQATKNISGSNTTDPLVKNNVMTAPLKGRISISSLDDVLGVITRILQSKEPRFQRLTNAFSSFSTGTTIGSIMNGKYLTALSAGFLESVTIGDTKDTFVFKPGLISQNDPLTLRLGYEDRVGSDNGTRKGRPNCIEIAMSGQTEIYLKIELTATDWDSLPYATWYQEGKTSQQYVSEVPTSYSSISTLLEYLEGTVTVGGTSADDTTTYQIHGTINVNALNVLERNFTLDLVIMMSGTSLKLFGAVQTPDFTPLTIDVVKESYTNIYYESSGNEDSSKDEIYFEQYEKGSKLVFIFPVTIYPKSTARVYVSDFKENILQWLLGYVLNFGSVVTDALDDSSSSSQAIHGEDLIHGFSTSGSISSPKWTINIGMEGLTHTSLFADLVAEIYGKNVTYTGHSGSKKSLYKLVGSTNMSIAGLKAVTASLDFRVQNISDQGVYTKAWDNSTYAIPKFSNSSDERTIYKNNRVTGKSAFSSLKKSGSYYSKPGVTRSA